MKKQMIIAAISVLALAGCDNSNTPGTGQTSDNAAPSVNQTSTLSNTQATEAPTTAPDNTAINTRDRAADAQTAGMTGQTKTDVQLTADIRKSITSAANMSVNAQNSKIVVLNGKVTLRGPVNTQAEKDQIGRIAADAAGAANVDNELEIVPATNP